MIARKKYLERLILLMGDARLKIITGIRRYGKSHLHNDIFRNHSLDSGAIDDHIIYIAFDDVSNNEVLNPMALNSKV